MSHNGQYQQERKALRAALELLKETLRAKRPPLRPEDWYLQTAVESIEAALEALDKEYDDAAQ